MSSIYHIDNGEDNEPGPFDEMENCLFCECHLVSILEVKNTLKEEFKEKFKGNINMENAFVDYLKVNKIAGHGCGNCVKGLPDLSNLFT